MKIIKKKIASFITKKTTAASVAKAAAGVVSLALLAGGSATVFSQVRQGAAFNPENSSDINSLRSNHVMFSEKDSSNNSEKSEKTYNDDENTPKIDDEANVSPEINKSDEYKNAYEEKNVQSDMLQNVLVTDVKTPVDQSNANRSTFDTDNIKMYDGTNENSSENTNQNAENVIAIQKSDENNSSSEHSGSGSKHDSIIDSGSSGENTSSEDSKSESDDKNQVQPEPTPTPEPSPSPDPTPDSNTDTEGQTEDPDYPDSSDGPKLPEITDPILIKPTYKEGIGANVKTEDIKLIVAPATLSDDAVVLYDGAVLTDWKLLCASYAWVQFGDERYRLTEYNEYFKVGEHPDIVNGKFKVKFYFRQRTDISWDDAVSAECEYDVKYAKILLMGESMSDGNRNVIDTFYIDDANTPILAAEQISKILEKDSSSSAAVTGIIPGISFSSDGSDPIYDDAYLKEGGRYSIYPLEKSNVPKGMDVELSYGWYDNSSLYIKRQMLVRFGSNLPEVVSEDYSELEIYSDSEIDSSSKIDSVSEIDSETEVDFDSEICSETEVNSDTGNDPEFGIDPENSTEVVSVPEGIYGISDGLKESSADILKIPSSVHDIDIPAKYVKNGYIVSEDNKNFMSEDGVLFKNDQTEILLVPCLKEELIVPESVKKINLESDNSIKKLVLNCKKVPKLDLSVLDNVQIVVPDDLYQEYLLAWGSNLGDCTLSMSDGDSEQTYTENNAIFSADGKTLCGITKDARGLFEVPECVSTIKSGAMDYCTLEEGIYISSEIEKLEAGILSADGINTVYFACDNPPDIDKDTFGDLDEAVNNRGLKIVVCEDKRDTFIEKWGEIIGTEYAEKLISGSDVLSLIKQDNGLSYLITDAGATLLSVPDRIKSFSDIEDAAYDGLRQTGIFNDPESKINWYRIGSYAFDGCRKLQVLELPDSITEIGSRAFKNCKNLEMILAKSKGTVKLGMNPFPDGIVAAFNASVLDVEDSKTPKSLSIYVNSSCDIHIDNGVSNIWTAGDEYTLVSADTQGTLLYGLNAEDTAYLIKATHDIKGDILVPDGYNLKQVISNAFEDCSESFSIDPDVSMKIEAIGDYSFANSGITGDLLFSRECFMIGEEAFSNCELLESITFAESSDEDSSEKTEQLSISSGAFYGSSLKEIVFEDNLDTLDPYIFADCYNLKSVTFTGETPPRLICYYGFPYQFGWETNDLNPEIKIRNGDPKDYATEWQYSMVGYGSLQDIEDEAEYEAMTEVLWNLDYDQIYDDNGDFRSNISNYIDDYKDAFTTDLCYKGMVSACNVLGLSEPQDPEVILPVLSDYVDINADEILPYELVDVDELVDSKQTELVDDLLIEDIITDEKAQIKKENEQLSEETKPDNMQSDDEKKDGVEEDSIKSENKPDNKPEDTSQSDDVKDDNSKENDVKDDDSKENDVKDDDSKEDISESDDTYNDYSQEDAGDILDMSKNDSLEKDEQTDEIQTHDIQTGDIQTDDIQTDDIQTDAGKKDDTQNESALSDDFTNKDVKEDSAQEDVTRPETDKLGGNA